LNRLTPELYESKRGKRKEQKMVLLASDFDKSKYMKAEDFDKPQKFKIKKVTAEEVGQGDDKERKLIVWFTNSKLGMVLNKTNNRTLRGAFGDDTECWNDKVIVIYPTMVDVRGKSTKALRIRMPSTQETTASTPATAVSGNGPAAPVPPTNGAAATSAAAAVDDPDLVEELADEPSLADKMGDEVPF
jgi:hypothetical protein